MTRTELGKEYVRTGRCFRCGKTRGVRSKWLCDPCHERRLSNERQAREVRVQKGLCVEFGCAALRVTETLCEVHRLANLERSQRSKRRNRG